MKFLLSCLSFISFIHISCATDSLSRSNDTFTAIREKFASTPKENPCVSWWQSANMYEEIANLGLFPATDPMTVTSAKDIVGKMLDKVLITKPIFLYANSNDDVLWWCLALERSYHLLNDVRLLQLAEETMMHVMRDWTDTCSGGLLWDHTKTYKNAITNELLLSASTRLFDTTRNQSYLNIALDTWAWFNQSGLIDPVDGLVDDGLADSPACSANYQVRVRL